ncbi:MAG TPA: hypothetical protein VNA20_16190 [Frankiaceae bacterium]|nr:hypothetical protein [Frankiaceae bacterium]
MTRYSSEPDTLAGLRRCQALAARLAEGQLQPRPQPGASRPHKLVHRPSPLQIDRLIREYEAGATAAAIALKYGIVKGTVLRLLHERGVEVRSRGYRSSTGRESRTS